MWISMHLAMAHPRSELETLIRERTEELQKLSRRLLPVQDEERRKLSRDLHDSTGQTLTALKLSVAHLEECCKNEPSFASIVSEASALANRAIGEIRTMSYLMHPPLLDEVGFACAAEWYIEGFSKRSRIAVTADIASWRERLPNRIEIVLFRVLQESLTNLHRHSGTSVASVRFRHEPENVILETRDYGRGIPEERLSEFGNRRRPGWDTRLAP